MLRVGYCMSEKKTKKLVIEDFEVLCRQDNIELIKIDLSRPVAEQGPFHLIFHKLTDQIVRASQGHQQDAAMIHRLQSFLWSSPSTVVIDSLESIKKLLDRHEQYRNVAECSVVEEDCRFFCPSFVEFSSEDVETNKTLMEEQGVQYPFVCKSSFAHGSSQSHKMMLIFNEAGLKDVRLPCVAQTFINHNACLIKVFVIGAKHYVVQRPSIKNLSAGDCKTIYFDSHDVSKEDSDSFLNQCDEILSPLIIPDKKKVDKLVSGLRQKLNLSLFGIDIIIENYTGRYAVIDINPFPSYVGVPDFFGELLQLVKSRVSEQKTGGGGDVFQNTTTQQQEQQQHQQQMQTTKTKCSELSQKEQEKELEASYLTSGGPIVSLPPLNGPIKTEEIDGPIGLQEINTTPPIRASVTTTKETEQGAPNGAMTGDTAVVLKSDVIQQPPMKSHETSSIQNGPMKSSDSHSNCPHSNPSREELIMNEKNASSKTTSMSEKASI